MGLNVRLYNINCSDEFTVSHSTGYTDTFVVDGVYSGNTTNVTIGNLEFDTLYYVKIENNLTNSSVIETILTNDSKYYDCYDDVNFYIEPNCQNNTYVLYDLTSPHGNHSSVISGMTSSYSIYTGETHYIEDSTFISTGRTNQSSNQIYTITNVPKDKLLYVFLVHGDGYTITENELCNYDRYPKRQGGFEVRTIFGCSDINCILSIQSVSVTNPSNQEGTNGTATINFTDGSYTHTYKLNGVNKGSCTTPFTITGLTANTQYTVDVINSIGCSGTTTFTVDDTTFVCDTITDIQFSNITPTGFTYLFTSDNPDGTLYEYSFYNYTTDTFINSGTTYPSPSVKTFTGLTPGDGYCVSIVSKCLHQNSEPFMECLTLPNVPPFVGQVLGNDILYQNLCTYEDGVCVGSGTTITVTGNSTTLCDSTVLYSDAFLGYTGDFYINYNYVYYIRLLTNNTTTATVVTSCTECVIPESKSISINFETTTDNSHPEQIMEYTVTVSGTPTPTYPQPAGYSTSLSETNIQCFVLYPGQQFTIQMNYVPNNTGRGWVSSWDHKDVNGGYYGDHSIGDSDNTITRTYAQMENYDQYDLRINTFDV